MEFRYKVKNMEVFKDGNVLGGKLLKAGEVLVLTDSDVQKIEQSGGVLEVLEKLIPNPIKRVEVVVEPVVVEEVRPVVVEEVKTEPKRRGRPKKVSNG